ncbi:MAG: DUF2145 domain-containing protein [Burkholderiaceae bacterium]
MTPRKNTRRPWPALAMCATIVITTLLTTPATAGQPCTAKPLSVLQVERSVELAQSTERQLNLMNTDVAVIARAGQDLRQWQQRFSHIGIVYKTEATPTQPKTWRVIHKLNICGSDRANLYRQGLLEFYQDDPYEWVATIVPLNKNISAGLLSIVSDKRLLQRMHERRYNMVAYPWSTEYQQSNQWVLETIALAAEPGIRTRDQAQAWLKFKSYQPDRLHLSTFKRLGARMTKANIAFDDHPSRLRFSNRIDTTTADSALRWLVASGVGTTRHLVR